MLNLDRCDCWPGFSGDHCEVTPCAGVDCYFNGKCLLEVISGMGKINNFFNYVSEIPATKFEPI